MQSWLKKLFIPVVMFLGVVLMYNIGLQFLVAPTREVLFEEFGQYRAATATTSVLDTRALNYVAPDFELPDVRGEKIKLSNLSKKAVMLVFWTTWNPAAEDQIAIVESYYQKNKDRGDVVLLAINSQENKSVVSSFLGRSEYQVLVLLDETGKVGESYAIHIVPTFYFIKEGRVRDRYVGILSENEIQDRVAKLSAEQ